MKKLLSLFAAVLFAGSMFATDMTCAEAAEAAKGGSKELVTVQGYVTAIATAWNSQYNNVSFWMADTQDGGKVLEAFRAVCEKEEDAPRVGDLVKATGNLDMYNSTPELAAKCTYEIIERAPEVELDTISVSDALKRIAEDKLGACYVKGKVMRIMTKGDDVAKYGNVNIWLRDLENENDSIQGYKIYGANNQKYTSAADIEYVEGDEIMVYANGLKLYNNSINEINGGYYVRTLSSSVEVVELDSKSAFATRDNNQWYLVIESVNDDKNNFIKLEINNERANAINGTYVIDDGRIMLGGEEVIFDGGFITMSFKEISKDGYNVYNVQASFQAGEIMFRLNSAIEIFAMDEEGEEIDLEGDRPFQPTEDGQEVTCAQAQEYTLTLPAGGDSEFTVVVIGYVTDIYADGQSFWMADQPGKDKVIQAFKFKTLSPAGVGLKEGAKVKLTGKLTHYVNSNTGASTAEVKNGAVEIIEGGEAIQADEEVNVAEALAIAQALEQNATSDKVYGITGFISSIVYAYDEEKGITFWMSDDENDRESQDFEAYQVHCSPEIGALLEPGVKVRVVAKITHFHQDAKPATEDQEAKPERTVYETVKGGTVELADGSAVDNIQVDVKAVKFIENGQIYILRNGVRYNVQGQIAQ